MTTVEGILALMGDSELNILTERAGIYASRSSSKRYFLCNYYKLRTIENLLLDIHRSIGHQAILKILQSDLTIRTISKICSNNTYLAKQKLLKITKNRDSLTNLEYAISILAKGIVPPELSNIETEPEHRPPSNHKALTPKHQIFLEGIDEDWSRPRQLKRVLKQLDLPVPQRLMTPRFQEAVKLLHKLGLQMQILGENQLVSDQSQSPGINARVRLRKAPGSGSSGVPQVVIPPIQEKICKESGGPYLKVLRVRQPWADLIVRGQKNVKNLSQAIEHSGPLLIYADQEVDQKAMRQYGFTSLPTGALVGIVEVKHCSRKVESPWHKEGSLGLYLTNPRRFAKPVPCQAEAEFFEVSEELVREALEHTIWPHRTV